MLETDCLSLDLKKWPAHTCHNIPLHFLTSNIWALSPEDPGGWEQQNKTFCPMLNSHLQEFPVRSVVFLHDTASQRTVISLRLRRTLGMICCLLGPTLKMWDTLMALWYWLALNIFQTLCRMTLSYITGLDILMQNQKGGVASHFFPSPTPMCRSSDWHLRGNSDNTHTIAMGFWSMSLGWTRPLCDGQNLVASQNLELHEISGMREKMS